MEERPTTYPIIYTMNQAPHLWHRITDRSHMTEDASEKHVGGTGIRYQNTYIEAHHCNNK